MMLFAFISCVALAPLVLCGELGISYISKGETKSIGEQVEFNCTVQNNDKNYKVLWFKLDKDRTDRVPLTAGGETIIPDERFSANYDKEASTFQLKINELQESDTGFYQCQILLSVSDKVSAEVELQIRRPPTISQNTTQSVNEKEGWPLELHCYADGFPVPTISWKRDDERLLPNGQVTFAGNVLKIPQATKEDRGLYICTADNNHGIKVYANVTVRVQFKPSVTAVRPRVGQSPGYDIELKCKIEAFPAPIVSWFRNGEELRKEQLKGSGDEFVDSITRYSVGQSDYGEYVCRAENELGTEEAKIDLFETIVPVCGGSSCG